MFILSDGESIILKPIVQPDISEFRSLMDAAEEWASDVELTEDDIHDAINPVRAKKNPIASQDHRLSRWPAQSL